MSKQNLDKTYEPQSIEKKWYQHWMKQKAFKADRSVSDKVFSIIMPPPNVTGRLHMGHALDQTCQDILVRFKRMKGFNTLWIPGMDHAGIATQSVVEKKIYQEEKKTKDEIGRKEFLKRIWQWKDQYGNFIEDQLKRIGISCDWDYNTFTMDDGPNRAVRKAFVDLYNEGLIYQADYIINWDPKLQSAISDAEVEHKEIKGAFYHLYYRIKDSEELLEVATTRPETLFGDTAVAVNPQDERFGHLIGKMAIVPICNREVPIIGDEHVDKDLGTGCLKVTPGHDFNDFEIGRRHNLPIINILNKDGTLNENAKEVSGLSTTEARKRTTELLNELDQLIKVEEHTHQVGHGQRSDDVIEPMVSKQWFLNVQDMAKVAIDALKDEKTRFYPKSWENTYFAWLKEPKDWCISRQLWWGHRIPVYYCHHCNNTWACETDPEHCPECKSDRFKQDPDVLDTWFSSGLWPMSTLGWPQPEEMKEKDFNRYFPTSTLITGYDIIFFWVARMMMMSLKTMNQVPFEKIYIHGIVRDKKGRKMSKSLGNGIDPIEAIEEYGADAIRYTLAAGSGYNRGLNLDPKRIEGYRNFMNKVWNAFRFIYPFLENAENQLPEQKQWTPQDKWILSELNEVIKSVNNSLEDFRFDDSCSAIYQFVYEKFCSWYIELSKTTLYKGNEQDKKTRATILKYCFKKLLALIHPISPFITEEIWQKLKTPEEALLINSSYPEYDEQFEFNHEQKQLNKFIEMVTIIRNLRQSVNLPPKECIDCRLFTDDKQLAQFIYQNRSTLKDLAGVQSGQIKNKAVSRPKQSLMGASAHIDVYIPAAELIDIESQVKKIQSDIDKTQKELYKVENKLSNEKFISKAPDDVVEEVKQKAYGFKTKLSSLEKSLEQLR